VPSGIPGGNGVFGFTTNSNASGVFGANNATNPTTAPGGSGVFGFTNAPGAAGVFGANSAARGVGVQGNGPEVGVRGNSPNGVGVDGTTNASNQSAIFGFNGAKGQVPDGLNRPAGNGVWGHTTVEKGSGVVGSTEPGLTQAAGVTGIGPIAGRFLGDVEVTGDIRLTNGQDCAEDFDLANADCVEPGTVMVLTNAGVLAPSQFAYDTRVVGVISGAGEYKPGIILGSQESTPNRKPVALLGKVYCKVDSQYGPVDTGDLLTTSPTPGHAMRASDQQQAFGSVIGKAMRPWSAGRGLIPVLIALQ
jgi:hypothetical protein